MRFGATAAELATTYQDMGRGNSRGQDQPPCPTFSKKQLKDLETRTQVKNLSGLVLALDALGVSLKTIPKGKGKGKGVKGKGNGNPSETPPTKVKAQGGEERKAKGSKGKGKAKVEDESYAAKVKSGSSNSGSSPQSSSQERPTIVLKSNPDIVATMLDGKDQPRIIQFICHQCSLAHYHQRKTCVACKAPRDPAKEPTQYDPDVHKAKVLKAQDLASLQKVPAKEAAAPAQAAASAPPAQPAQGDEVQETPPQALDESMAPDADETEVNTIDIGQWHPACLNKASMKLCIQEECTEVLQFKKHFDITDLAESELRQQVEGLRRRISIMSVDPALFGCEWVHAKQKLDTLEEQLAKEDASQQTTGEHHATGGKLRTLLGRHLQAMHLEEQEHEAHVADVEAQILELKAGLATREKEYARKNALNEALRVQLETKVNSFTGPTYRLAQLGTAEATQNISKLTEQSFNKQWLQETGLSQVASDEVIQVLIAKAMTVAQQAQAMGIRTTPPIAPEGMRDITQPFGAPGLQLGPAASAIAASGAPQLLAQQVPQMPAQPVIPQSAFHSPTVHKWEWADGAKDDAGQPV